MLDTTHTRQTNALENIDWDDVLDTLEEQKCVLFLGHGAFQASGGGQIETALSDWLNADDPEHPHIHDFNPDGFFLFRKSRYKRKVIAEMKAFYSQPFPEAETDFARIARIPFSMIFTLTPDNILARTFDATGFDYQPDFYFRNRKAADEFEKPTLHKPLLYNLLGNIEEPESLVLTHRDFFDYLESVFLAKSMTEGLREELEKMERYIFLGLPYEKWYFQLLLRVLSLHSEKLKEVERLALKEFEDPHLHKLYTEEFKIEFFPASTEVFIGELYRRCETAGLLKPLPQKDPTEADIPDPKSGELREMIARNEITEVLKRLKVFFDRRKPKTARQANDLLVLRNRFHLLNQRMRRGTIDSRDLAVEHNQVVEGILGMVDLADG